MQMKAMKKLLAVLLVCLFVLTSVSTAASAEDAQPEAAAEIVEEIAEAEVPEAPAQDADTLYEEILSEYDDGTVEAASAGSVIGRILGIIVFSPFLLIDFIIWVFSGFNVHIFYDWLFD